MVSIKSDREIELMKEACRITAETHNMLEKAIKPGMSTNELDKMAEEFIKSQGGIPAQKGYPSGVKGVPAFPQSWGNSFGDAYYHHENTLPLPGLNSEEDWSITSGAISFGEQQINPTDAETLHSEITKIVKEIKEND